MPPIIQAFQLNKDGSCTLFLTALNSLLGIIQYPRLLNDKYLKITHKVEREWSKVLQLKDKKQRGRQEGLFIDNQIGLSRLVFPLGLENLHDDLLLLDEESPHDLLTNGLVAQDSAISPRDDSV